MLLRTRGTESGYCRTMRATEHRASAKASSEAPSRNSSRRSTRPWALGQATAISPIARMLARTTAGEVSLTYSHSSDTMGYALSALAMITNTSIFSSLTYGVSLWRAKKDLKSPAKSHGACWASALRCSSTTYVTSGVLAMRVRRGGRMRSRTCWWISSMPSVMRRKIFVVASTTAEFACCRRSSRTFMMSKTSSSFAGVYLSRNFKRKHCAHSLKAFSLFSRP
mmetsp:Transcript_29088/g.81409  ORF Transcript_29088/g.81409 Transcript_29088/m.81409 type:complete len:224 (+) Transcript_29088:962-1633(+)